MILPLVLLHINGTIKNINVDYYYTSIFIQL